MLELQNELTKDIDPVLVTELLDNYRDVKRRFLISDLEPAIQAAGRFCESVLKCVLHLYDQRLFSKMGIPFEKTYNEIINKIPKPTDTLSEYKFRLIPEIARTIYTLRNKKKGQHARGEDLLFIDLSYISKACDWIIGSFLFISHRISEEEIIELMKGVIQFDFSLVIRSGEYLVITEELDKMDAVITLVSSKGGKSTQKEIAKNLKLHFTSSTSYKAIKEANNQRLIFLNPDTKEIELLPGGIKRLEELTDTLMI
ncbi:MAG: hypothetical protein ACFFCH_10875 [Promethearchaeota archaeon]